MDLTRFGSVYFRISTTPGSLDFEEGAELAMRTFPAVEFNVTSVLVVTWYKVAEESFASQVAIISEVASPVAETLVGGAVATPLL